jgi:hypothetical protein
MRARFALLGVAAFGLFAAAFPAGGTASPVEDLRKALLWYEGCESLHGRNQDLGVRINGATLVDGKIGRAILLERRDANRLANPDFDGLGGWIVVGRPVFTSAGGRFSPGCVQISETGYVRQVVTELRSGDETWYCLSAYAKSDSPATRLELGVDHELCRQFPLTAQYTRLALPFQAGHENSTITLRARGPGRVTIDAVQLEPQRSFPSSFSAVAVRPTQSIEIPVSPRTLNADEGSVAFWIRPLWLRESGTAENLFAWWGDVGEPGVECLALSAYPAGLTTDHDWHNRIVLARTRGRRHDGFAVKSFPLCDWTPGSWHHVVAAWRARPDPSPSQLVLYLDGRALPLQQAPWGERKTPARFSIGYYWGAYADAVVDEICVFRRVLTPAEVDCLFQLRSPLQP